MMPLPSAANDDSPLTLRKDVARLKVKSFALLTVKSSASPQVKSDADASDEIKSVLNPPKADYYKRSFLLRRK